jgi:hypothetical protein
MLPKTLNPNMYVERDHLKMFFSNALIQLTLFDKDRHTATAINLKKKYFDLASTVSLL